MSVVRFDRRLVEEFDWILFSLTLILLTIGLVGIYSATLDQSIGLSRWVTRQIIWVGVGFFAMGVGFAFDYRRLEQWAPLFYFLVLVLLLSVPLIGSSGGGARRWISLGGFSLQPSEFMKVALVLMLARLYHKDAPAEGYGLRDITVPVMFVALPAGLILLQPNLGTAVTLCSVFLTVTFTAGIRLRALSMITLMAAAIMPFLWTYLRPYQQRRVLSFLHPDLDPLGAGYHMIQSKLTVGSGMFWGKGFLLGTQNRLDFLPEKHTDFIFAVFAEEWGFIGTAFLLFLYVSLLARLLVVALRARERFGLLIATGVVGIIFWQFVINVGMNVGLLPVVGVPLPFLSYGGSSLVTSMLAIGLALNASTRRYTHSALTR